MLIDMLFGNRFVIRNLLRGDYYLIQLNITVVITSQYLRCDVVPRMKFGRHVRIL
jgi:hypothetical protein